MLIFFTLKETPCHDDLIYVRPKKKIKSDSFNFPKEMSKVLVRCEHLVQYFFSESIMECKRISPTLFCLFSRNCPCIVVIIPSRQIWTRNQNICPNVHSEQSLSWFFISFEFIIHPTSLPIINQNSCPKSSWTILLIIIIAITAKSFEFLFQLAFNHARNPLSSYVDCIGSHPRCTTASLSLGPSLGITSPAGSHRWRSLQFL